MTDFQKNVLYKKNIILIPEDYDGISTQKGILSLSFNDGKVEGNLRCYNLKETSEEYVIGVQIGENTFKTKASAKELKSLKLEMDGVRENSSKISCVIVKLKEKSYSTLLWGSTETTKALQNDVMIENMLEKAGIIEQQERNVKLSLENEKLNNNYESVNFESQEKRKSYIESIEEKQDEIFEDEMLESYIDACIEKTEDDENYKDEREVKKFRSQEETFFDGVESQASKLFESNEEDEILEQIIPESKFCKVKSEDGFYVFGVIKEKGKEKCICYGVPCEYKDVPPKEIDGICSWLPINENDYTGKGYWMTYQDAITGENISVEII